MALRGNLERSFRIVGHTGAWLVGACLALSPGLACALTEAGAAPTRASDLLLGARNAAFWAAGALLVLGAVSALARHRRRPAAAENLTLDALKALSVAQFEEIVAEGLRAQGYVVSAQGRIQDRHAVLQLTRADKKFLVHCNHSSSGPIELEAVQALHTAMMAEGASAGLAIAGSGIAEPAKRFAAEQRIAVIDSQTLVGLVNRARGGRLGGMARREPYFSSSIHEVPDALLSARAADSSTSAFVRSEPCGQPAE